MFGGFVGFSLRGFGIDRLGLVAREVWIFNDDFLLD